MSKRSSKSKRRSKALPALGIRRRVFLYGKRRVRLDHRSIGEYAADLTESESGNFSR